MNSKEALKELCCRCYVDSDLCTCHPKYRGGECKTSCEYKETIKQDLERLEKLEKAIKILKNKTVVIVALKLSKDLNDYNRMTSFKNLTQEEYELLKEIL